MIPLYIPFTVAEYITIGKDSQKPVPNDLFTCVFLLMTKYLKMLDIDPTTWMQRQLPDGMQTVPTFEIPDFVPSVKDPEWVPRLLNQLALTCITFVSEVHIRALDDAATTDLELVVNMLPVVDGVVSANVVNVLRRKFQQRDEDGSSHHPTGECMPRDTFYRMPVVQFMMESAGKSKGDVTKAIREHYGGLSLAEQLRLLEDARRRRVE